MTTRVTRPGGSGSGRWLPPWLTRPLRAYVGAVALVAFTVGGVAALRTTAPEAHTLARAITAATAVFIIGDYLAGIVGRRVPAWSVFDPPSSPSPPSPPEGTSA